MTELILIAVVLLVLVVWRRLHGEPESHEQYKSEIARLEIEDRIRAKRREEYAEAYKLAKEELGEEPTVEQILLTRDQLRTQRKLDGPS